jgi:hypothetical protein
VTVLLFECDIIVAIEEPAGSQNFHRSDFLLQQAPAILRSITATTESAAMPSQSHTSIDRVHKDRMRDEINAQVEAFLKQGGVIDVLGKKDGKSPSHERGSVWHSQEEIYDLVD